MKSFTTSMLALLVSLVTLTACAADYTEGQQYQALRAPQPTGDADRIEVVELFWYGCPHCYSLEPNVHAWLQHKPDDVSFVRLPAILGSSWELLAKAYFTADLLGVLDTVHGRLFAELHEKKQRIRDVDELRRFFVAQGVEPEAFDKMFNSFAVNVKLNNARMMTRRYAITGVPALIVNGKYSTSASQAGGNEAVMKVVDYLVERERKAAGAPVKPAVLQ